MSLITFLICRTCVVSVLIGVEKRITAWFWDSLYRLPSSIDLNFFAKSRKKWKSSWTKISHIINSNHISGVYRTIYPHISLCLYISYFYVTSCKNFHRGRFQLKHKNDKTKLFWLSFFKPLLHPFYHLNIRSNFKFSRGFIMSVRL